jgi:lipopolysaccharide export system permease protein
MPILWRYMLSQYLKVFFLSTVAFIAVLLTTRAEEIAHFATLGPQGFFVLWFTLYQIPYILPIAIPFSCLISAVLLIKSLSVTHELTALRTCGFAIRNILAPILLAASLITLLNFYIVSEMATNSHLATGLLKSELRSLNPLLLLNNKQMMKMKGFYFDTLGPSRMAESAGDIVLAMPNKSNNRLNMLVAKNLQASMTSFVASDVTLISSLQTEDEDLFDHLMLENIQEAATTIQDFSQMVQKKVWSVNNDHLRSGLLLVRIEEEQKLLDRSIKANEPASQIKIIQRNISRSYAEILRRLSIALAVFTFTLMGAAFGINISRNQSNRGLFFVIGLATLYLVAFFTAKSLDHLLLASISLYIVPHIIIVMMSIWALNRASKGIE